MGVLLETVTLADWREVVSNAKSMAQAGDPQARSWLAQYLMGKPEGKAPTPLTVVVQQLNGVDPLVHKLAYPAIERQKYPVLHSNDAYEDGIRALIAAELVDKIKPSETGDLPMVATACDDSSTESSA
jgi:hypothetical protein